jgi:hypothetical protein
MTSLSAKYLLIQGQSRQTANVSLCAPSLATSLLYLSQMEPRVFGQGCSPLQRPYPLFFLSLSPLAGRGWPFETLAGQDRLASPSPGVLSVICPSCRSDARVELDKISLDVPSFLSCKSYSKFALSIKSLCKSIK